MSEKELKIDMKAVTTIRHLNVDKIRDLEDVKRFLKFLNIQVEADKWNKPVGFELVEDLFD